MAHYVDLPDLRALAAAALGPEEDAYCGLTSDCDGRILWGDGDTAAEVYSYPESGLEAAALAAFWAALTPTSILSLLDEVEAARAGLSGRVAVRHLGEALVEAQFYDGVVLLVDHDAAGSWCTHPRRLVLVCDDAADPDDPTAFSESQADQLVEWARDIGPSHVLVACHYGVSRSPAAARIVLRAWGWPADLAAQAIERAVPRGREVDPNPLILSSGGEAL